MAGKDKPEHLEGSGARRLGFNEVDMRSRLKFRAYIEMGLAPVFQRLEEEFRLSEIRREGILPIIYLLELESRPVEVSFAEPVETPFRLALRRHREKESPGDAPSRERLLLDIHVELKGREGDTDPLRMTTGEPSGEMVQAGRMRVLQVLTRPLAEQGNRQVTEVPEGLKALAETPFEEPWPSIELLSRLEPMHQEREIGPWRSFRSVWSMCNTDINQHVNVNEYLAGMEEHFARMLWGANLPVKRHQVSRASLLFRKPFFLGQQYCLKGRLFCHGDRTLALGGYYDVLPEGGLAARPSVFVRMEGEYFARV